MHDPVVFFDQGRIDALLFGNDPDQVGKLFVIVKILSGRQPSTLQLDDILKPLPATWGDQYTAVFNPQ